MMGAFLPAQGEQGGSATGGPELAQLPRFDSFWSPVSWVTLAVSPLRCLLGSGKHWLSQQTPLHLRLSFP